MPLRRKSRFASLALLLFTFPALLEFASAQCAIKPIKPIPPLGCTDVTPQCVTNSNGQSYWTWVCVAYNGSAGANPGPAREAPAQKRDIQKATDQSPLQTAPVNPVVEPPQTHAPISEDSKPAVETLRMIAQRIGECPKLLMSEVKWGGKKDEIVRMYELPPANVLWDVIAGSSVRAPYLGYVEFALYPQVWVPDSAAHKAWKNVAYPAYLKLAGTAPWHYRYEYDLGPNGLQLTRALWHNNNTGAWNDYSHDDKSAKNCWDTAARNTQASESLR